MLAFSNDYYGMIFRATQSVELFCAYLHTVCRNVDMILGWNPPIQTTHTKEFQL